MLNLILHSNKKRYFLLVSFGLLGMMLQLSCRTTDSSPEDSSQLTFYDQLPKSQGCPKGAGLLECEYFEDGAGGDTEDKITSTKVEAKWIRDLAQFYSYQTNELGKDFDKNIYQDLSFEDYQILALADVPSTQAGRYLKLDKIEKIDGSYTVYLTSWQPVAENSKCEQFSYAVFRPYLFLKVKHDLSRWEGTDAKLEIVKTDKFYRCSEGQVIK
jgi:hypothetical protein